MKVPRIRQAAPQDTIVPEDAIAPEPVGLPYLTYALLALLTAIFACEMIFGTGSQTSPPGPSIETLVAFGGVTRSAVIDDGEWWRLLSAPFLHADVVHLLANGATLFFAGTILEHRIGRWWLATVYLAGALTGALFSLATIPMESVGIGASGAITGLFATMVVVSFRVPPGKVRANPVSYTHLTLPTIYSV